MSTYIVTRYEEAPSPPDVPHEYATLREARGAIRRHLRRVPDRTLAGTRYDDGTIHVEAYYDDRHRSSGYWILTPADSNDDSCPECERSNGPHYGNYILECEA